MEAARIHAGKVLLDEALKFVGEQETFFVEEALLHCCDALKSKSISEEEKDDALKLLNSNLYRTTQEFQLDYKTAFTPATKPTETQSSGSTPEVQAPNAPSNPHLDSLKKDIDTMEFNITEGRQG